MGLFQKAYQTYETLINMPPEKMATYKEPLAPMCHMITEPKIEITIDNSGEFIRAVEWPSNNGKIAIPVTVESANRSSAPSPHILCDNVGYLAPNVKEKHELYVNQLELLHDIHPFFKSVLNYIKKGNILEDLKKSDLYNGDFKKIESSIVCWRVNGIKDEQPECWNNENLKEKYCKYFMENLLKNFSDDVCMVTGDKTFIVPMHLKGVFSFNGNAKIISCNDKTNFTFRGRFKEQNEAMTVSYEASQKSHNALKWLIANDSIISGGRAFICWNPHGKVLPKINNPLLKESSKILPGTYKKELRSAIENNYNLTANDDVVIAAFDAATTGRLSVTYYNELRGSDFLDRLLYWDETCIYNDVSKGVRSPSLYDIILYAYGQPSEIKIVLDDKIIAPNMQRLINCKINKERFPTDIKNALVLKASNLVLYKKVQRRGLLSTTVAVLNKYRNDLCKEEACMALEKDKKDISYQYGRLLAILEKIEEDTYDSDKERETNAIRLQSAFVQRPLQTSRIIIEQLKNAYYPKLSMGSKVFYENQIASIFEVISSFDDSMQKQKLNDSYLLGYYLQRNWLWSKKEDKEDVNTVEEEN